MAWNTWNGNGGYNRNYPNRSYNNNGYNGNYGGGGRWNGNYQNNGYNNNGGNYNRSQKPKYTKSEKMAYNSGMGYALAMDGKGINFDTPKMRESFNAGYKYGRKLAQKNPKKYFDKNKSKKK